MLVLKNIKKEYGAKAEIVPALRGVDMAFRKNEFVAILGHSGCGKTTLLNIIGGLDRYTDGELYINGVSTKEYKDRDWDTYRNHSIGFVFQSYNLISHQSVLANVELALTVSGVPKKERRKRAVEALAKVGLAGLEKKRPNQLSGGQMQRVAIARALINDPEILLADEPTGALDTDTSEQVMDILREVAKERLVIMVTHNPELADKYATRIIRVRDGLVTDDSAPYTEEEEALERKDAEEKEEKPSKKAKKAKKASMNYRTAFSLSLNNLMTKKARTILTSVAGSIGIIGIALILALSTGVNNYINQVQRDALSSYPIQLEAETADIGALIQNLSSVGEEDGELDHELDAVYENTILYEMFNALNSMETSKNNLAAFKAYLEDIDAENKDYIESIKYTYNVLMNIYTEDTEGKIIKSDAGALLESLGMQSTQDSSTSMMAGLLSSYSQAGLTIWEEMLPGAKDELISDLVKEQYDLIATEYGSRWPEKHNEILLCLNERNEITDIALYTLGLRTSEEIFENFALLSKGETVDKSEKAQWSYSDIIGRTFKYIYPADYYVKNGDKGYLDISGAMLDYLYESGEELVIVGIIRPNEDASSNMLGGSLCYTSALTSHIIEQTALKDAVVDQLANPDIDIFTNTPFITDDYVEPGKAEKAQLFSAYIASLTESEKALLYTEIICTPSEEYVTNTINTLLSQYTREALEAQILEVYSQQTGVTDTTTIQKYISQMSDEDLKIAITDYIRPEIEKAYYENVKKLQIDGKSDAELSMALAGYMSVADENTVAGLYDSYMPKAYSEATYKENLDILGYVDYDNPSRISLYASTFEDKDRISDLIDGYNGGASDEDKIEYVDYMALLLSSVTQIINAITYVLVAFVSISLVVSSIMIGVITYISVLERTKEIGILRAIGASKGNISSVFNAETMIIGLASGLIGVIFTVILCIPINIIIRSLSGIQTLGAVLPIEAAIILVLISVALTVIAGLIPSKVASRKDPVVALRTE